MILTSFIIFLLIFVFIGVYSSTRAKSSNSDYLLAGKSVSPWLAGLSAVATNNSGYMFIGMIGYTYISGIQSIWVLIAWFAGDLVSSMYVHRKLRAGIDGKNILSFGGAISHWDRMERPKLRKVIGVLTVLFLGAYAAAQLNAGSKALHVLFGWNYNTGALIGAMIVFAYCLSGGIRASIWTDAAQSIVMMIAMGVLCWVGISNSGGFSSFLEKLNNVSPHYLDFFPNDLVIDNAFGMGLFVFGWFMAGMGVIGQPHIMIRFMTVESSEKIESTKRYYYFWYLIFCALTFIVGLSARLIFPEIGGFDKELVLPMMGQKLLPEFMVGVILAGIFAATMSTADSQILSCSAAITRDLFPNKKEKVFFTKLATGVVTLIALSIAIFGGKSVFSLVLVSWSILAATLGPLLLLNVFDRPFSEWQGILMILVSILVTCLWRYWGLNSQVYEVAPGVLASFLTYFVSQKLSFLSIGDSGTQENHF